MPKKFTNEDFIKRLANEHPELEALEEYRGDKQYILVRCKIHNHVFRAKPNRLHWGQGCQKCYDARRGELRRKPQEQFIKEMDDVYNKLGKHYNYSKVKYVRNNVKVTLICDKHGEFSVTPNKILTRGDGCPKCAIEKNGFNRRLTQEQFIEKAIAVHGDKYDYSNAKYITCDTPITIGCKIHGNFKQTPESHLSGTGCPLCNESHLEKEIRLFLDNNRIRYEQQKRFTWLEKQSLDFYLPEYNMAIECQGGQHFFTINHWEKNKDANTFENILKRDKKKYDVCQNHLSLIYFSEMSLYQKSCDDARIFYKDKLLFFKTNDIKAFLIHN